MFKDTGDLSLSNVMHRDYFCVNSFKCSFQINEHSVLFPFMHV